MISFLCAVEVIEIMTRMLCVFFFRFIKESNQEDEKYSAFFLLLLFCLPAYPSLIRAFQEFRQEGMPRWWTTRLISACPAFLCGGVFFCCVGLLFFFFYMFGFFANFPLRDFQDRIPPGQKISHAALFAVTSSHLYFLYRPSLFRGSSRSDLP